MTENKENILSLKTYRLIIVEWATLLSVFLGCFLFLFYKIEKQSEKNEHFAEVQSEKLETQAARTDRLYEMFIELIKEKKG